MTHNHKGMQPIFNCNNMVDPIKKILLNHPKNAFFNQKKIDSEFKELNFLMRLITMNHYMNMRHLLIF